MILKSLNIKVIGQFKYFKLVLPISNSNKQDTIFQCDWQTLGRYLIFLEKNS